MIWMCWYTFVVGTVDKREIVIGGAFLCLDSSVLDDFCDNSALLITRPFRSFGIPVNRLAVVFRFSFSGRLFNGFVRETFFDTVSQRYRSNGRTRTAIITVGCAVFYCTKKTNGKWTFRFFNTFEPTAKPSASCRQVIIHIYIFIRYAIRVTVLSIDFSL